MCRNELVFNVIYFYKFVSCCVLDVCLLEFIRVYRVIERIIICFILGVKGKNKLMKCVFVLIKV